jgi:hypothetical protein
MVEGRKVALLDTTILYAVKDLPEHDQRDYDSQPQKDILKIGTQITDLPWASSRLAGKS